MRFSLFRSKTTRSRTQSGSEVTRDADELIQLWGAAAYERATDLSWREDTGLVASPRPGHWWSVRREIGRRIGHTENEPQAEFAA